MTPLVLLPGALGAASQYAGLVARLAPTRPVVALDFPGHGENADAAYDVAAYDVAAFAEYVAGYIATELPGPADVFGYSMGGYVALYLARHYPDRVRRVCTLATKLAWTPELGEREARRLDPDRLEERAATFVAALAERHPGAGWRTVVERTAGLLRDIATRPPVDDAVLAGIAAPVRITVGDRDELVTIDECVAAYRVLREGELQVLPGVPHPIERMPEDTLAALVADALPVGAS